MAVAVNKVAQQFLNVQAGVAIPVAMQVFEASDIRVIYGIASHIAVQNVDYTISLANDFNTFTIVPTASLIAKINALIAADPSEQNYITVRRELDLLTESTSALARYTPFTSREHDRSAMRDQQLSDRLNRSLQLGERFVTDGPLLTLAELEPNRVLIVDPTGTQLIAGPNADEIENAQAYAEQAAEAANSAGLMFANLDALLAYTGNVPANAIVTTREEGYRYRSVATTTADAHIVCANARFYVVASNGEYPAGAFNMRPGTGLGYTAIAQRALDYISAQGGGVLKFGTGVFNFDASGALSQGRKIGLQPRNNVTIRGAGMMMTTLRVQAGANIDLIAYNYYATGSTVTLVNFWLEDLTLDGNAANQSASAIEGFNLRIWGFLRCGLINIMSVDPNSWGIRIEVGEYFTMENVHAHHVGAVTNNDGIHLVDVSFVTGTNISAYSEGDDAFAIEAANKTSIANYAIAGLRVSAPNLLGLPARGLHIAVDPTVNPGVQRSIRNVHITGFAAYNVAGGAIVLGGAYVMENVKIEGVADLCGFGASFAAGNVTAPGGVVRGCHIDLDVSRCTGSAVFCNDAYGTFTSNIIHMNVTQVASDITPVITLRGTGWCGSIGINYPGTSRPANGLVMYANKCDLSVNVIGCVNGINVQDGAHDNVYRLGRVDGNAGGFGVTVQSGVNGNVFVGGRVSGGINNDGFATRFEGVVGAETYGSAAGTTDANGDIVVAHGLNGTPVNIQITPAGASDTYQGRVYARNGTDFTIKSQNAEGAAYANASVQYFYTAKM